jgi:hypothetical protein
MTGARSFSLCAAGVVVVLALFGAGRARAEGKARGEAGVVIHYESDDQLELARRVASELLSEGYTVDISRLGETTPCDVDGPRLVTVPRGTKAWIRLASDPANPDTMVASICYLGAQPFLQQAAPSAPRAEASALALATAEALNGLRSRLPPLEADPEQPLPPKENPPDDRAGIVFPAPSERFANSAALGAAVVWNLPDFPAAPGVTARATLALVPHVGILIDAFVPTAGRELASEEVTATVRSAWFRVGPRIGKGLGDFDLSVAALAGPAITWATAVASPPRTGAADVSPGAVLTLSAFVEYPREATIFACAAASGSALLPGARVNLGDDATSPRGSFPVEASIGFGARWGETREGD